MGIGRGSAPNDDALESLAPSAFAGSWLQDGRLCVAYTDDPERHVREAHERLGLSPNVTVVRHRRTIRELQRLVDAMFDETGEDLRAAGARLYAAGVDVAANVVEVLVEPLTPAARALLQERYGDVVRPVEGRVDAT